jgi:FMN hydrolase / 5-amino-6-(5-phospho-D-ribitylamino)uracil phosphatase
MPLPLLSDTNITVITIDLDDTLWDNKPVLEYAEAELYAWLKDNAPGLTESFSIADFKAHRKNMAIQNPDLRHDMTRQRHESLAILVEAKGYDVDLAFTAMEVFLQARNKVTLFDDVTPVLDELSNNYDLVAVSNGNADIKQIGIDHYFKLAIAPSDIGTSKPDPLVFEIIMERMKRTPEMFIHIGDEPETDILGAQNAGIRNIWLNRNKIKWPVDSPLPDIEISTLYDLIPAINTFN